MAAAAIAASMDFQFSDLDPDLPIKCDHLLNITSEFSNLFKMSTIFSIFRLTTMVNCYVYLANSKFSKLNAIKQLHKKTAENLSLAPQISRPCGTVNLFRILICWDFQIRFLCGAVRLAILFFIWPKLASLETAVLLGNKYKFWARV